MVDFIDAYDVKWDYYLEDLGADLLDVYYTKEYCRLYECENSKAYLFVYKEQNNIGLYPILLSQISVPGYERYFDIETPYGYGGPIVKNNNIDFNDRFEKEFMNFCQNKNVIAEFIRFHPLLKNQYIFKKDIDVVFNRTTVYVDLKKSLKDIWDNDICSKNRNMIRKAEKNKLEVKEILDYNEFMLMYNKTMDKVNAESFYYFDNNYYKRMLDIKTVNLLAVKYEEKMIAGAIFMGRGKYFHYHLSGSLKEYLKFSPNNLLLWNAIKYSKEKGYEYFHLGGGITNSKDDNLYRFKQKFSSNNCEFFIGKRKHNKEIYSQLINKWREKHKSEPSILLQYREY